MTQAKNDNRSAAVELQEGLDVLKEVPLLVRGRRPEVGSGDGHVLTLGPTILGDHRHRGLAPERRIRQHHVEAVARIGSE